MYLTTIAQQNIINQTYTDAVNKHKLLPIKVTPFFQRKIDKEVKFLGHTCGPLHRIAYPSHDRLNIKDAKERADFVNDAFNMQNTLTGIAIQKYQDRIIFFTTNECIAHCQYCFRQSFLADKQAQNKTNILNKLEKFITYLKATQKITEVILSGGEPMLLSMPELATIFTEIKKVPNIKHIRLHTKALTYAPELFTVEKLKLFKQFSVRLVFHIVHPYEICTKVKRTIKRIKKFTIKCYNQFPLIRNINDHHEVIIKLLEELDELGVRNLSIFYPDAVNYSVNFRISFSRIFKLIDQINFNTPSWINALKFTLDTAIGKVQRENLLNLDKEKNIALFERDGKIIEYPDLDSKFDQPGDIKILLWRNLDSE